MEIRSSIVKLFEEDEDETMHSEADVEASQDSLHRDIEGRASTSQPLLSNTVLPQGSHQTGAQVGKAIDLHSQQALQSAHQPKECYPKELNCLSIQKKQFQNSVQITGQVSQTTWVSTSQRNTIPKPVSDSEEKAQCLKLQEMGTQRTSSGEKVSIDALMHTLLPQLDRVRATHLPTLYEKMQRDEITEEVFVQRTRDIVGKEKLCLAVNQQTLTQQNHPRKPSFTASDVSQFTGPYSFAQLQKKSPYSPANSSHASSSVVSVLTDSSYPSIENNAQYSQDMDHQSDSRIGVLGRKISSSSSIAMNQERDFPSISGQGLGKQQQQKHLASYCASDVSTSGSSLKSKHLELQTLKLTHHQSMGPTLPGLSTQAMNMMSGTKFERHNSIDDPSRLQDGALNNISTNPVHRQVSTRKEGPSIAQVVQGNVIPVTSKDKALEKQLLNSGVTTTNNMMPMNSVSPFLSSQLDHNVPNPSITSPAGVNARTPQRKPSVGQARTPQRKLSVGQKKQLEACDSLPPLPSKKQKVSESEQSIEQINDVTACVNLQEEVEQLLSGRKDSQVSEAFRKVVQEEEERGILLKIPLRKKLAEIMAKCGLKNISNDVERCLSMSVEERMHGLICNLIKLSKQRADAEKPMHLKLITSDVQQQIIELNRKAKEELEEKQAEVEKLQKLEEPKALLGKMDRKTKKEEDDKMIAAAANVVARAAVGVDDMLSKWQHMAELARQKHEREIGAASSSQATYGASRNFGRNQEFQTRVARTISVKDLIAVLSMEPQMYRSRLVYFLFESIHPMAAS